MEAIHDQHPPSEAGRKEARECRGEDEERMVCFSDDHEALPKMMGKTGGLP